MKKNRIKAQVSYRLPNHKASVNSLYQVQEKLFSAVSISSSDFVLADFKKNIYLEFHQIRDLDLMDFCFSYNSYFPYVADKTEYLNSVNQLIGNLKDGVFDKVVYSRVIEKTVLKSPITIFTDLCEAYPSAFVYLMTIEGHGTWIGATPESFLEIDAPVLRTTSLAGTKSEEKTPWGAKEIKEQKLVSDYIEDALKNANVTKIKRTEPYTFDTGAIFHIKTDFTGEIESKTISTLIDKLHPTPATCGLPKETAMETIPIIELHNRLFYTGFLGPTKNGNANLFVNLRCMQIIHDKAYLYVGGGITADSIAEDEWDETVNKSKTLACFLT